MQVGSIGSGPLPVFGRNPAFLARNPMDALSDVLKSLRLEGAFYLNAEFSAPW